MLSSTAESIHRRSQVNSVQLNVKCSKPKVFFDPLNGGRALARHGFAGDRSAVSHSLHNFHASSDVLPFGGLRRFLFPHCQNRLQACSLSFIALVCHLVACHLRPDFETITGSSTVPLHSKLSTLDCNPLDVVAAVGAHLGRLSKYS